jgi:hypothetical protein
MSSSSSSASLLSTSNLNNFFLSGNDFHKIEKFVKAKQKTFEIQVCSHSFFFSDIQLLLISKFCFEFILKTKQPFIIEETQNISKQDLLTCFQQLYSLLSLSQSICISSENVIFYQYLSKILDNSQLSLICDRVKSSNESTFFLLSSICFGSLDEEIQSKINNFEIILREEKVIKCNNILSSLISNKIAKIIGNSHIIDFSSFKYPYIIIELFSVLKGKIVLLDNIDQELLIETILFLNIEAEMLKDFICFSIQDLSLFKQSQIEQIISSNFFHLINETALFEYIFNEIEGNRNKISLIEYIYFGLINYNSFIPFISSIEFSEISNEIFEHFKKTFYSTFLNFKEESNQQLLSFSSLIKNFCLIEYNYFELYHIFNIPINISLFENVLSIEQADGNILTFKDDEKSYISLKAPKNIILINFYFSDFEYEIDYEFDDFLFIIIPNSITSLNDKCFYKCLSLRQISLPSSITSLGNYCFSRCSFLAQISLPDSILSLGYGCFSGCSSLTQISLPNSITSLYDYCFLGCPSLSQISLPDGITSLSTYCFSGCSSLTQISFPNSLTSLSGSCFSGCSSLTRISLPNSITSLDSWCFWKCSSLIQISLPNSITLLGNYCFLGCSSLTQISLPNSIISLGNCCFIGCSSLTQIFLPNSIKKIGNYCFA